MATIREELIQNLETQKLIRDAASNRLLTLLGRNNKKYEYTNNETKHLAEIHDIDKIQNIIDNAQEKIDSIHSQFKSPFVAIKNVC